MAMLFTGAISDRYGRRVAVGFSSTASFIFGFARAFAPGYLTYVTLHFLEAGLGGGMYPSAYVFSKFGFIYINCNGDRRWLAHALREPAIPSSTLDLSVFVHMLVNVPWHPLSRYSS